MAEEHHDLEKRKSKLLEAQLARKTKLRKQIEDTLKEATESPKPPDDRAKRRHLLKMNLGYPVLGLVVVWGGVIWSNGLAYLGISYGRNSYYRRHRFNRPIMEGMEPFVWLSLFFLIFMIYRYVLARWLLRRGVPVTGEEQSFMGIPRISWGRLKFQFTYEGRTFHKAAWGFGSRRSEQGEIHLVFDPARPYLWLRDYVVLPRGARTEEPTRQDRRPKLRSSARRTVHIVTRTVRVWRRGSDE